MPRITSILSAAAVATAMLSSSADAHTNMAKPVVKFPDGFYNGNSPYGRIDGDKFTSASSIPSYQGVNKIAKVMEGYKTLRQMIMSNVVLSTISGHTGNKECGLTLTTGDKQPIPDAIDFPWGHPGPCEAWCDNTRLFYNADCQGNNVGKITVDKSKCSGASIMQVMYVGVHVSNWEIYSNCAPLEGGSKTDPTQVFNDAADGSGAAGSSGSAGAGSSGSNSSTTTETPTLTPATSSSTGSDSDGSYDSPATTTPTPSSTDSSSTGSASSSPSASSSSGTTTTKPSSCKRRMRRD